jgi:hypothetical protein
MTPWRLFSQVSRMTDDKSTPIICHCALRSWGGEDSASAAAVKALQSEQGTQTSADDVTNAGLFPSGVSPQSEKQDCTGLKTLHS